MLLIFGAFALVMYLDYKCKWNFLYDSEKHLKTASFVAVFGLVGTMGTLYNYTLQKVTQEKINDKKLVAEIIAKSRIEWLREMREHVSAYMSLANQASFYAGRNLNTLHCNTNISIQKEYDELVQKAETIYYKIIFNMNSSESIFTSIETYRSIYDIANLYTECEKQERKSRDASKNAAELSKNGINNYQEKATFTSEEIANNKAINTESSNSIINRIDYISTYRKDKQVAVANDVQTYFKKEWDKAKKEIISGEVAPPDK